MNGKTDNKDRPASVREVLLGVTLLSAIEIPTGYYFTKHLLVPYNQSWSSGAGVLYLLTACVLLIALAVLAYFGIAKAINTNSIPGWSLAPTVLYFVYGFVDAFAESYKSAGLYGTHCANKDLFCLSSQPVHDGLISLYFSVITLTSVGYGDYIPANDECRMYAGVEAISGYLLLALMVAFFTKLMVRK